MGKFKINFMTNMTTEEKKFIDDVVQCGDKVYELIRIIDKHDERQSELEKNLDEEDYYNSTHAIGRIERGKRAGISSWVERNMPHLGSNFRLSMKLEAIIKTNLSDLLQGDIYLDTNNNYQYTKPKVWNSWQE